MWSHNNFMTISLKNNTLYAVYLFLNIAFCLNWFVLHDTQTHFINPMLISNCRKIVKKGCPWPLRYDEVKDKSNRFTVLALGHINCEKFLY